MSFLFTSQQKKSLFFLLLPAILLSSVVIAQNIPYTLRFDYKLDYHPDTNNLDKQNMQEMVLLVGEKGSVFKRISALRTDSIAQFPEPERAPGSPIRFNFSPNEDENMWFIIFKEPNGTTRYTDIINRERFEFTFNKSILNWSIQSDTATINGYFCQKATCTYGKRNWDAWFTTEIPVSDGPFVFNNLPGLIVKMVDSRQHYIFNLTGVKQLKGIAYNPLAKPQTLSKEQFYKSKINYAKNKIDIDLSQGQIRVNGGVEAINAMKERNTMRLRINNNRIDLTGIEGY